MGAGEGADRIAARIAEGTQRLAAQGADPEQLAARDRAQRNHERGGEGERLVAQTLEGLDAQWRVIHDVHWPGRRRANLDHIAIGPTGVFVIDAKNYSAPLRVAADGTPFCGRYPQREEMQSCQAQAAALAALLAPQHRLLVRGVLCLVAQDFAATTVLGTTVVGRSALLQLITSGPAVLSPQEVTALHDYLVPLLGASRSPELLTTAQLRRVPSQRGSAKRRSQARHPAGRARPVSAQAQASGVQVPQSQVPQAPVPQEQVPQEQVPQRTTPRAQVPVGQGRQLSEPGHGGGPGRRTDRIVALSAAAAIAVTGIAAVLLRAAG